MLTEYIVMTVVAAVLGGYIITSIVLFRFPQILHKKKNLKFRPRHISHRGGAGENLENTMTAFQHAVKLGTEMLELDCHITKDGQVVVSHDNSLKRMCGVEGTVEDFIYEELPLLKTDLHLDFNPTFVLQGGPDRRIPLLREVFEAFPTVPINIDIKIDNDELIQKVHNMIVEFQRESLTAWGNRSSSVTSKLYKLNPDIALFFSLPRVALITVSMYTGLLPFLPLKESCFEVIMPSIISGDEVKLTRGQRFLLKTIDVLLIRPALFHHLERRGIQSYLWVLNKEKDFDRAFKVGSTGVMTDFPTMLTEYLAKNHPDSRTSTSTKGYQSISKS